MASYECHDRKDLLGQVPRDYSEGSIDGERISTLHQAEFMQELEEKIADILFEDEHIWRLTNGYELRPEAKDVRKVLDTAAGMLYDGKGGYQVIIAGLLIYKTKTGYDVYVL